MKNLTLLVLMTILIACQNAETTAVEQQAFPDFEVDKDYFTQKASIEYAKNFSVEYHNHYKVVRAKVGFGAAHQDADSLAWERAFTDVMVLVQRGTPAPPLEGELAGAQIIEIPVNTIAGNADDAPTRFLALEVGDKLVGLGHGDVYDEGLRKRFLNGEFAAIGASWHTGPNLEVLLETKPELTLLTAASITQSEGIQQTRKLGLAAAPEFSWSESSYLGQLEWIKYDALFLNAEAQATRFFEDIKKRCEELKQLVAMQTEKPGVLWGMHSKTGNWTVRANGAIAELMEAAGAKNPFADNQAAITETKANGLSEGIPISDEIILTQADQVDFIISFQS
ncbi:MAG: ABC transporter substrate-binding protein, partial [Cyanothece sp. SIO1E1]|nr:ABC transporter substrate-binding protein [Cyanothece sp. SIO1E1]